MSDYDAEDWGEYGNDDDANQEQDGDHEISNNFYEAEGEMKQSPAEAIEKFKTVILLEEQANGSEFTFKAMKNVVVLSAHDKVKNYEDMIKETGNLLRRSNQESKAEVEQAINEILDMVNVTLVSVPDYATKMFELILGNLKTSNERLWFNTSLRLGQVMLGNNDFKNLDAMLVDLKRACRKPGTTSENWLEIDIYDKSKSNILLELFAQEIQMYIALKDTRMMKSVFNLTEKFDAIIDDPRVMGILKECGGKMFMSEKNWQLALDQFRASFNYLIDGGNQRAQVILKYTILASLLAKAEVDQMQTNEAKVYARDPQIEGMGQLKNAIEKNDIKTVQRIVADKELDLLGDPFIALYLEDLLRTVRLTALVSLVAPYKTVKLDFLARKMNVDVQHIRSLLSELILEERIEGQIDQVRNVLELASSDTIVADKHRAMSAWGDKLLSVHRELLRKVNDKQGDGRFGSDMHGMGMW